MHKNVSQWQVAGFLFTSVFGTFLHFLFDLTGQNVVAGLFSAVNESIWEHMKLVFFPMFLFAWLENYFWGKEKPNFWCVKLIGIGFALLLIPVLYYTYTGIFGLSVDWLNIAIFFIAAGAAFWLETRLFAQERSCRMPPSAAFALLCAIALAFILLTFFPPHIPLFQDPLTGTYGYQG